MTHTLTFYSVAEEQLEAAVNKLDVTVSHDENTREVFLEGETPLGKMKARIDYDKGSGQLTVVVVEKPMLLSVDTIKAHINNALAEALKDAPKSSVAGNSGQTHIQPAELES